LTKIVRAFASTRSGALLAATENGIFRSLDDGESWVERSIGLTMFRINVLAVASDGTAYAGAAEGEVFRSMDEGDRWRPMGALRGNSVYALMTLSNGDLLVGSRRGIFRWTGTSQVWQLLELSAGRRPPILRALVQDNAGVILAGTEGDGVFASFDEGVTWQAANDGLTTSSVFALGLDAQGRVVAGTSDGVFRDVSPR
jgi:ligand-binding sensor domain-containing protein